LSGDFRVRAWWVALKLRTLSGAFRVRAWWGSLKLLPLSGALDAGTLPAPSWSPARERHPRNGPTRITGGGSYVVDRDRSRVPETVPRRWPYVLSRPVLLVGLFGGRSHEQYASDGAGRRLRSRTRSAPSVPRSRITTCDSPPPAPGRTADLRPLQPDGQPTRGVSSAARLESASIGRLCSGVE
jgi:hypothetical protein